MATYRVSGGALPALSAEMPPQVFAELVQGNGRVAALAAPSAPVLDHQWRQGALAQGELAQGQWTPVFPAGGPARRRAPEHSSAQLRQPASAAASARAWLSGQPWQALENWKAPCWPSV